MEAFAADINEFVSATKKRMRAVTADATQAVIKEAQTPISKGGNMPIDTGFLRNTGQISYNGLPVGPSSLPKPEEGKDIPVLAQGQSDAVVSLGGWTADTDIWFGWTAEYAVYQESINGFLRLAVSGWSGFVADASKRLQERINARRR
jgi:hypothetical protein